MDTASIEFQGQGATRMLQCDVVGAEICWWCSADLGISTHASHAAACRNLGIDNSITNMIASCSQSATAACGISAPSQSPLSLCSKGNVHHESTSSIFVSNTCLRTCSIANDVFRPNPSDHPAAGLRLTNVNTELESDMRTSSTGLKTIVPYRSPR